MRYVAWQGVVRSKLTMLQLWNAFGNQQPGIIAAIEKRLWRVLLEMVLPEAAISDLLNTVAGEALAINQ